MKSYTPLVILRRVKISCLKRHLISLIQQIAKHQQISLTFSKKWHRLNHSIEAIQLNFFLKKKNKITIRLLTYGRVSQDKKGSTHLRSIYSINNSFIKRFQLQNQWESMKTNQLHRKNSKWKNSSKRNLVISST